MGTPRKATALCLVIALLASVVGCGPAPQTPSGTPSPAISATTPTIAAPTAITAPATATPVEAAGSPGPAPTPTTGTTPPKTGIAGRFASYKALASAVTPRVKPYQVAPDLSNVDNLKQFTLSPEARQMLAKNAFVVTPSDEKEYVNKEFFHLYERLSYDRVPAFVTTDALLHIYHLLFDKLLRDLERESLSPALVLLTKTMAEASQTQYEAAKGTALEGAAKRNLAFFAVGAGLLKVPVAVPAAVKDSVDAELKLVEAHSGAAPSPVFEYTEDYSQYTVRGHYTKSEALKDYFKAMMWYGRMTFLAKGPPGQRELGHDQTRSALLVVSALTTAKEGTALATWEKIYRPTAFFVGASDDLTVLEYHDLAESVFGDVQRPALFADEAKLDTFVERAFKLRPPQINSMVLSGGEDREEATVGMRFMGQRFVLDAAVFQRLVDREVPGRYLPRALDVPAAMGSAEAYAILEAAGETKYPNYQAQMAKAREKIKGLSPETWTQNLYWSWLYTFQPLLQDKGEGYPTFMRSKAWVRKDLHTNLGSWTELKHDTILYAKQSYAERGDEGQKPPHGYVEPNPEVFGRLAALTRMTREGLAQRALLAKASEPRLVELEEVLLRLKAIAEKELAGEDLSEADDAYVEAFGATLEGFTMAAADPEDPDAPKGRSYIESLDAAVVADVATGAGQALEVAVGRVLPIYVVVPVGGRLQLNKGGVFSYYEFTQPLSNRLTDEEWRAKLERGAVPARPDWTESFIAP